MVVIRTLHPLAAVCRSTVALSIIVKFNPRHSTRTTSVIIKSQIFQRQCVREGDILFEQSIIVYAEDWVLTDTH